MGDNYLWRPESQLNHVAQVRYKRGDELTDIPGVNGIGIGKDHIILYVSSESVEVPRSIEDVQIVKICRTKASDPQSANGELRTRRLDAPKAHAELPNA